MNDDEDDYDPDVESFLEYAARKARRQPNVQPKTSVPLAGRTDAGSGIRIQAALHELQDMQKHAVSVDDFIFALRSVASRLDQEADRLQAGGAINFHVCYVLQ